MLRNYIDEVLLPFPTAWRNLVCSVQLQRIPVETAHYHSTGSLQDPGEGILKA